MKTKFLNFALVLFILMVASFASASITNKQMNIIVSDYDIIIPDDFPTIQEGIDNANPWDKILIKSGIYNEKIVIEKEGIILQGENKYNTVIDGCKTEEDGILINAENVTIQEITITNFRQNDVKFWAQAGIKIYKSNATIKNNRFIENRNGIEIFTKSYNITIADNVFIKDGIFLGNYMNGKEFPDLPMKEYIHNITNNTVNGLPLYYCRDKNDFQVPLDVGQIILINCTNVTIKDIYMSNNDFPILLAYCYDSVLENLIINDVDGELLLINCDNNTIQNNKISNTFKAICIEYKSKNNVIRYNDFSNSFAGISVFNNANNNSIYENKAYNCDGWGMEIVSYHGGAQMDNIVSENLFYDNNVGILLRGGSNRNIVQNNSITNNNIGMLLDRESNYNRITNNTFKKDIIPAIFYGCTKNYWYNNYWNRPRVLPKMIIGVKLLSGKIPIPSFDFDMKPAKKPTI